MSMLCIDMSIVHLKFGSTRLETNSSQGEWWYKQEYLCEFVDTVDQVFSYESVMGDHAGSEAAVWRRARCMSSWWAWISVRARTTRPCAWRSGWKPPPESPITTSAIWSGSGSALPTRR